MIVCLHCKKILYYVEMNYVEFLSQIHIADVTDELEGNWAKWSLLFLSQEWPNNLDLCPYSFCSHNV